MSVKFYTLRIFHNCFPDRVDGRGWSVSTEVAIRFVFCFFFSIGPLDRGCQELIIPVCKNFVVSQQTLISVDNQKYWYLYNYGKPYDEKNVETDFPSDFRKLLEKYPKCKENLKKLYCGEYFPPCFPNDSQGHYSICRSVCDDIVRDCPEFFR